MAHLELEDRSTSPTLKADKLRATGMVPMALIEQDKNIRLVQAPISKVLQALSHASGVGMLDVKVKGESKNRTVVVKQVDYRQSDRTLLTVTIKQIAKDETISAEVAVIGVGVPEAVSDGHGVLGSPTNHVTVRGKANELPQHIDVDVSGLQLHESISASALALPAGVDLISSADATLFSLQPLRHTATETTGEATATDAATPASEGESTE